MNPFSNSLALSKTLEINTKMILKIMMIIAVVDLVMMIWWWGR